MRNFAIVVVSALLLAQLLLLPTRSPFRDYSGPDRPRMTLPSASNGNDRSPGVSGEIVSWTEGGGWVVAGLGAVDEGRLEAFLRQSARETELRGFAPWVQVRIPADASAGHFVKLTKCLERAGIESVRVAVVDPDEPWF